MTLTFQESPVAAPGTLQRQGMRGTLRFRGSLAPAVQQPT